MNTSKDYRILLAEDALRRLEEAVRGWILPYPIDKSGSLGILRSMRSSLLRVKYSFLPARMILETDEYRMLEQDAERLKDKLLGGASGLSQAKLSSKQRLRLAEIKYALWMILGLRGRLMLGDDNVPEHAVDVIGVEVTRAYRHPDLPGLTVTRASTGRAVLTIVTNITGVRVGEVRGAAILPPVMFGGIVSEAMFAGSAPLPGGGFKGRRIPLGLIGSGVRAEVMRIAAGKR